MSDALAAGRPAAITWAQPVCSAPSRKLPGGWGLRSASPVIPSVIPLLRTFSRTATTPSTVQELLGQKDVRTIMVYTHVLQRGGLAVKSPLDE